MKIIAARLPGIFRVEMEPARDQRGYFARTYCAQEFAAAGLNPSLVQINLSSNNEPGTLRGLHFQREPHAEAKLIRCLSGRIWDVVVDIRPASPHFGQWEAFELSGEDMWSLYVSEGFAHGFQSLTPNAQVLYNMSEAYHPESIAGVRWDDPDLAISWPKPDPIISPRDARLPFLLDAVPAETADAPAR